MTEPIDRAQKLIGKPLVGSEIIAALCDKIESLQRYGENMRQVCQWQAKEIERLDPTRPRAESQ